MIATLTLMAAAAQIQAAETTTFAHKFVKDEKTVFTVDLSGNDEGSDMKVFSEFELTTKETTKEGTTPCSILVKSANANFGGQEIPMTDVTELSFSLDKHGVPTEIVMGGLESIYYIVFVTRYLPNKPLKQGETFKADVKMGGSTYKADGTFTGTEELEGKKYSVLTSKGEFVPEGDTPGSIETKSYFDAAAGKVVRTDAVIGTPGGDFKLVFKVKK
jgi:hypothetical protein